MVAGKIRYFLSKFTLSLALISNISSALKSGTGLKRMLPLVHPPPGWRPCWRATNKPEFDKSNVSDPGPPDFSSSIYTFNTVVKGRNLTLRCSVQGITSQHTVSSYN